MKAITAGDHPIGTMRNPGGDLRWPGLRRRETLRSVGLAFVVAGLVALVARSFGGHYVVDSLTRTTSAEPAVEAVWNVATSLLVTVATSAIAFGALMVIATWLAGENRLAHALRGHLAPYAARSQAGVYGAAALVFLLLVAWAPIAAFRKPLGVLVFALLFAVGTELWRRQILTEEPPMSDYPLSSPRSGDAVTPPRK